MRRVRHRADSAWSKSNGAPHHHQKAMVGTYRSQISFFQVSCLGKSIRRESKTVQPIEVFPLQASYVEAR
jgi:hypothetical protein